MTENPKDNVRQMFVETDDGIRVFRSSGEVVGVNGFTRGQSVEIKYENEVDSGWKIDGFNIISNEPLVMIRKGNGADARRETIHLKKLREMNPV